MAQCCKDHVEAAKAGHVACLRALTEEGRFLALDIPRAVREGAGVAHKLQPWEAAMAACEAGMPAALAWVLRRSWSSCINVDVPWHERDAVPEWEGKQIDAAFMIWLLDCTTADRQADFKIQHFPLSEIALCHAIIKSPKAEECLGVLLRAGCQSEWLCTLAVLEGKPRCFWAAVEAGCPITGEALKAAAQRGRARLLEIICFFLRTSHRHIRHTQDPQSLSCRVLRYSVEQALRNAVKGGHASCVEILLEIRPLCSFIAYMELCKYAMEFAAMFGPPAPACLEAAHRAGGPINFKLVMYAAAGGNPDCLDYVLMSDPGILSTNPHRRNLALYFAVKGGSVACIRRLEEAGCTWDAVGPPGLEAAYNRNPARLALSFYFPDVDPADYQWEREMDEAIKEDDEYKMSLLYECGYEHHRSRDPAKHPARVALKAGSVACLKPAVEQSGLPSMSAKEKCTFALLAALEGEEMLRWVHGLGLTLHRLTAVVCARRGDVGTLRWLFEVMPTTVTGFAKAAICEAAVMGNSLECLRLAWQHGYRMGNISKELASVHKKHCPLSYDGGDGKSLLIWSAEDVKERRHWDLEMLRYLVRHMDRQWAISMLKKVAGVLEHQAVRCYEAARGGMPVFREKSLINVFQITLEISIVEIQWSVIIFLGKELGNELPDVLAGFALIRAERAQALAGVVYRAGQLAKEGRPHPSLPSWRALASLPPDVWERIASEAHLAVPARDCPLQACTVQPRAHADV